MCQEEVVRWVGVLGREDLQTTAAGCLLSNGLLPFGWFPRGRDGGPLKVLRFLRLVSPEDASTPWKPAGAGTVDVVVVVTVVDNVEVSVKVRVAVSVMLSVSVEVVEKVSVTVEAVTVTVVSMLDVAVTVVADGVMVTMGVDSEKMTTTSGNSVLVVELVGIGDWTGFLESFVLHTMSVDVVEVPVTVKRKADMIRTKTNNRKNWDHILRK